jgi:hypothetical protein
VVIYSVFNELILMEIVVYAEDVQQGAARTRQGRGKLDNRYNHHHQAILKLSSLYVMM